MLLDAPQEGAQPGMPDGASYSASRCGWGPEDGLEVVASGDADVVHEDL